MQFPTRDEIESLKKMYPKGTVVELDHMDDPQAPPTGTRGVVKSVDGMGQLQISWETGSGLALIPGEDSFHKINRFKVNEVDDTYSGKTLYVLVDTQEAGFPSPYQYDQSKELMFIHELCTYLNLNIR